VKEPEMAEDRKPELSVVIPVYNEAEIVDELAARLRDACSKCCPAWEIVLVNDGSTDDTLERLVKMSNTAEELRVIDMSRNFGHMAAVAAGVDACTGAAVVVMDADLQDPPELIPEMFQRWKKGARVVLAVRSKREESFLVRHLTDLFYRLLSKMATVPMPRQVGTFSLMDRSVVQIIRSMPERQRYFAGLRAFVGFQPESVPYERQGRGRGKSKVGFLGLLRLARTAIVGFSAWPLRFFALLNVAFSALLIIFSLCVVAVKLFTGLAVPGWASTMVLVGCVSAFQALCLATLCEYVASLYVEVKGRPLYVVRAEFQRGNAVSRDRGASS
jgi:glycosyltransferase involved in cell wall biosynthesis